MCTLNLRACSLLDQFITTIDDEDYWSWQNKVKALKNRMCGLLKIFVYVYIWPIYSADVNRLRVEKQVDDLKRKT